MTRAEFERTGVFATYQRVRQALDGRAGPQLKRDLRALYFMLWRYLRQADKLGDVYDAIKFDECASYGKLRKLVRDAIWS